MKRPSPNASPAQDILAEAQERVAATKASPIAMKHVRRLQSQYSLPDEAVLGLRLLTPFQLQRFVTTEEKNVSARLSSTAPSQLPKVLIPILAKLDPAIGGMVAKLRQLDAQGTQVSQDSGGGNDGDDDEIVQTARARVQNHKPPPWVTAKMEKLQQDFVLGDEVVLAMRMLDTPQLSEFFAGEGHIRERLASEANPSSLVMWLISQLDPEVETLVKKIVELDGSVANPPSAKPPTASSPPHRPRSGVLKPEPPKSKPPVASTGLKPSPPKTKPPLKPPVLNTSVEAGHRLPENGSPRWRPLLKQIYQKHNPGKLPELPSLLEKYAGVEDDLYKALASKYGFPADRIPPTGSLFPMSTKRKLDGAAESEGQAKKARPVGAASASGGDGNFAAAQQRLEKNKTPANSAALAKLKAGNDFSDETLLALRLIPTAKLQELAGRQQELKQQLDAAPDRNQSMMQMIWAIDPQVPTMVRKLAASDEQANTAPRTSAAKLAATTNYAKLALGKPKPPVGGPKPPALPPPSKPNSSMARPAPHSVPARSGFGPRYGKGR